MKFNTTAPIYLQIINHIKKDIVTNVLASGSRIVLKVCDGVAPRSAEAASRFGLIRSMEA